VSQLHARLFEKWLDAGDDRTFSEWLAYRRECATQERQRRAFCGTGAISFYNCRVLSPQHQQGMLVTGRLRSSLIGAALGGLGGIFR